MSKYMKAMQVVLFGLLAGAFCSGCDPTNPDPTKDPGDIAGQAGAFLTGGNPSTGGSPCGGNGAGGNAGSVDQTGGSSGTGCTGSGAGPATGGSSGTGGNETGGEAGSPETGGSSGEAGTSPVTGGTSGAGSASSGGTGAVDPITGGTGGDDPETGGMAGSLNEGGSGNDPSTGGEGPTDGGAGGDIGEGGAGGDEPATGGQAGAQEVGGAGGAGGAENTGGTGNVQVCTFDGWSCDEPADCCSGNCYNGMCVDELPEPFSCDSNWVRYELGTDLTGDGTCLAADDCYLTHSMIGGPGKISRYDGSEWSIVDLDVEYPVSGLLSADSDGNVVYAGGAWNSGGVVPWGVLLSNASGDWAAEVVPPMTIEDEIVRSIRAVDGVVVISTDVRASTESWDTNIFIKRDGTWTKMVEPPHAAPFRITKVWGFSADELYAVGARLDTGMNLVDAVLWQYDGSEWSEVATLPSDVVALDGVSGNADGELVVAGATHDGTSYHGVTLVTNDLVNWQRYDTGSDGDSATWSPRLGAALVASTSGTSTPGSARLQVSSEGTWTMEAIGGMAAGISDIWNVPGTNQVMLATQSYTGSTAVYVGTCQ